MCRESQEFSKRPVEPAARGENALLVVTSHLYFIFAPIRFARCGQRVRHKSVKLGKPQTASHKVSRAVGANERLRGASLLIDNE
jgi:hypothetical protein